MIALGGTKITKAFLGSTELANIAIGDELLLSSEPIEYLQFKDAEVWRVMCVKYGDHDGSTPIGITAEQCAAVSSFAIGFMSGNKLVTTLDDLVYFTSISSLPNNFILNGTALLNADLPSNITRIEYNTLRGCTKLEYIVFRCSEVMSTGNNSLYNTNNCLVYVPDNLINDYKAAASWKQYASRFRPLSDFPS